MDYLTKFEETNWAVKFVEQEHNQLFDGKHYADGVCNYDKNTIFINKEGSCKVQGQTLFHEALHAAMPWLTEEHIARVEVEVVECLRGAGYAIRKSKR